MILSFTPLPLHVGGGVSQLATNSGDELASLADERTSYYEKGEEMLLVLGRAVIA